MKNVLPLGESPIITFLYDANPLSILSAHGDTYFEWLISNYIQLNANKDIIKAKSVFLEFYGPQAWESPFLYKQIILRSTFVESGLKIHDFIKFYIDQGYYIYCEADDYYIPDRLPYQNLHLVHDMFVYGYDDIERVYYILGYNNKFTYAQSTCSYTTFEKAFYSESMNDVVNTWADNIRLLKYKPYQYKFNMKLVKHLLSEYLSGQNSYETYNRFDEPRCDRVYGIEVYDKVLQHLTLVEENNKSDNKKKDIYLDNHIFRLLMEHKKLMMMRMEFINNRFVDISNLINAYKQVEQIASKSHGIAIKYWSNESLVYIEKLKQNITLIKKLECNILKDLLEKLDSF
ncbi:BtrH N-terminal domain-containing protein [Anaerosporobacter faecicola]|uniref:BtrH N-terminal domain-containing protein n=1 Tax=Anaerosporobacter faecicola TaxID=2718714 RepID=UPI001438D1C6|nr:BtrH N-terminal domain-containing protein [Anaerosporobacter faecicola]